MAGKNALFPKKPGMVKVVAVMGYDRNHNGVGYETALRDIFIAKKDWQFIFVRSAKAFAPALIGDADLFVACRNSGADPIDLYDAAVSDVSREGAVFWDDTNTKAVVENIHGRGMGFLSLHFTLFSRRKEILDVLGVEPVMHRQVQPIWAHDLNQAHPITSGLDGFMINLDEQFGAVIKSGDTTTLFETTGMHDKRELVGGWCREYGRGRVVTLLPGHTGDPYNVPAYREIVWRSAHWALGKDIPPFGK